MLYGRRPRWTLAGVATSDPQDLQTHSIFPTYFTEVAITFAATDLSVLYDVQNVDDGAPVSPAVGDTTMFFKKIALNLSNLTGGKQLHFDLYDEVFRTQNCNPNDNLCDPNLVVDVAAPASTRPSATTRSRAPAAAAAAAAAVVARAAKCRNPVL